MRFRLKHVIERVMIAKWCVEHFETNFCFHFSFDERFAHVLSIYHCDIMPLAITFFCRSSAAKCFRCASNYQQINDEGTVFK